MMHQARNAAVELNNSSERLLVEGKLDEALAGLGEAMALVRGGVRA
jgi:hypothetical protein